MANPPLGAVVDPFTGASFNTTLWNGSSSVGSGFVGLGFPGSAFIQASTAFHIIKANGPYAASGQAIYAKVTPLAAGTGGTSATTYMEVLLDGNNQARLQVNTATGSFQASTTTGGTATTVNLPAYDPAQHAWWRLREVGGSWAFDTSADGAAWTTLATIAYGWSPAAVAVQLACGTSSGTLTGNAYFEHFNTPLGSSTLMPSWPKIQYQVAFNTGGQMTALPSYVDLSTRLRGSWSATLAGRQYELDQVQSGQLGLTLWNLDGALDPTNTASPYYPNVVPMRACRLQAVWPPTRNLLPQNVSSASSMAGISASSGSTALATGLAAAPTGHTTALSWTMAASLGTGALIGVAASNNVGQGWPVADGSAIPVVAGQSYTFSAWVAQASGGDATLQAAHKISWYDVTGTRIVISTGTAVTVPVLGTTWTQTTYTVTAPAGAVSCRLGVQNSSVPSVSSTLYVTAWQMEQAAAATAWTAGGVVYPLWAGYVERWPQQWSMSGTYGLVDLTCIDLLAGLAQFTLQPSFSASLLALKPEYVYPLNEGSGAQTFNDLLGLSPQRLVYSPPGLGAGGGTITAGNSMQGSGSVGSSGPVVTVTNPNWGLNGVTKPGVLIAAQRGKNLPPTTGGLTRVICYRTTSIPTTGNAICLWSATGPGAFGSPGSKAWLGMYVGPDQHMYAIIQDQTGAYGATVPVPDILSCDGNWHIAVIQVSADLKTFTVANDNHGYAIGTAGTFDLTGVDSDTIGAMANPVSNSWQQYFQGDLAFAAQYDYPIGNTAAFDLGSGFSIGWAGETSAARAQRILTMCGYGGTIQTEGATIAMGGANLSGTDPMSALTLVGDTEAGQVFVDGAGVLWLTGRLWRYLQANPTVTFGENQSSGEVPYLGDVSLDFDTTHIYNVGQVSQVVPPGSTQPPDVYVPNATSQQAYLPRTLQRSINTQDQTLQTAMGQYLVSQYGQPLPRLAQLNVDLASNPALWSKVLPLGFGTRAQVNRRPPTGPGAAAISVQQFVEHLSWAGDDQGNFKLALQLTPAGPYLGWWVASSLHTTVATASTAGTATVTLAPLTGSASNPAAAVLVPGTQLTLSYGTANAETLTVLSVAATSPGYTSVAVTFTANTAHNHALGDVVCQPLPGGYAMPAAALAGFPAALDAGATLSSTGPRVAY